MRTHLLAVALVGCLAAGCSEQRSDAPVASAFQSASQAIPAIAGSSTAHGRLASLPDRGNLFQFERSVAARARGAYTAYPIQISEDHALHAIAARGMVIASPDGRPIRLQYVRHVEHPDGNWTWVGRPAGSPRGAEAVLTFGDKAVFGSIPTSTGTLHVTTAAGRTWLVQGDAHQLAALGPEPAPRESDVLLPAASRTVGGMRAAAAPRALASSAIRAQAATPSSPVTVDVILGYTTGFATRLGGQSQAATRLQYLVDLANQAYADSQVAGRIRMVKAVQVDYPDATSNQSTLFELSGLSCSADNSSAPRTPDQGQSCTPATVPAALQPLVAARKTYGADLVSLVRNYSQPENGSCGVGWLIGAAQTEITRADIQYGFSVVSDSGGTMFPSQSTTCREEYLVHELGHNMGLQHDRQTAGGSDDTNGDSNALDPEEFGRYPYSFGYSTSAFYTIMSLRRSGQTGYLVFSSPNLTSCGGVACGVADEADNVRALNQTMPLIATFASPVKRDFNGDGRSDLLWRNTASGSNTIWKGADASQQQATAAVTDVAWTAAGTADFNGDGQADILWRNGTSGLNVIWRSGNKATQQAVGSVTNVQWSVAGVGDFDGDGVADVLWRNGTTGGNAIWLSANKATQQAIAAVTNVQWKVAAVGDFNGDGKADIFWRNTSTGANVVWLSANNATQLAVLPVTNLNWKVAGVGDFDGDGRADVLWHDDTVGTNAIWKGANKASQQTIDGIADVNWRVADVADYDGDGQADVMWRNHSSGANVVWRSGNKATPMPVNAVTNMQWVVMP